MSNSQQTTTQTTVQTVTGPIDVNDLGRTLMHEHLFVTYPGAESDTLNKPMNHAERLDVCVDKIEQMKAHGVNSMLDPCPNDLGRDVGLMVEVAQKTGFNIVCATGLYKEDQGGGAYWKFRAELGGSPDDITEMYVKELTEGIGDTGVRAGIIKVATGQPAISEYEHMLLLAAAAASVETGAPITTHTDTGVLGDQQQRILTEAGVPAHRIIIGHSCGSDDFGYHMGLVEGGSYLGFDRFGIAILQPDEVRVASLLRLLEAGCASRVVISHDSVWCWGGSPIPDPEAVAAMLEVWTPTHFIERIVPMLKDGGATDEHISMMLDENPRRFFAGEALPALG